MSKTKDNLVRILSGIQNNREQLVQQLNNLDEQRKNGSEQLAQFDSLIAMLQVTLSNDEVLASVSDQEVHISKVPLTDASGVAAEASYGGTDDSPADAGAGAPEVPAQPGNADASTETI